MLIIVLAQADLLSGGSALLDSGINQLTALAFDTIHIRSLGAKRNLLIKLILEILELTTLAQRVLCRVLGIQTYMALRVAVKHDFTLFERCQWLS